MEKHALAIIGRAESWDWPNPPCLEWLGRKARNGRFTTVSRNLLSGFITESHSLGGTLVDRVWDAVEKCHPQMKENVRELRRTEYTSPDQSEQLLFDGVDRETVDFNPVFKLAAELFTHLGVMFMNMDDHQFGGYATPSSVGGIRSNSVEERRARKKEGLKLQALKRDGTSCPLTGSPFFVPNGFDPVLTYVIPPFIDEKPDTVNYIAMLAGERSRDIAVKACNSIKNVMSIKPNAATSYVHNKWGIEALCGSNGTIKYIFRDIPFNPDPDPRSPPPRDGDEINFGSGPEGQQLDRGPHPLLCNIRLSVGRVLNTSGAAELITQLMVNADDADHPHVALKDKDFHDVLNAKLLVSGRAFIA